VDERKIQRLEEGAVPFFEPDLLEMVARGVESGMLRFTTSYDEGLASAYYRSNIRSFPGEDQCRNSPSVAPLTFLRQARRRKPFESNSRHMRLSSRTPEVTQVNSVSTTATNCGQSKYACDGLQPGLVPNLKSGT